MDLLSAILEEFANLILKLNLFRPRSRGRNKFNLRKKLIWPNKFKLNLFGHPKNLFRTLTTGAQYGQDTGNPAATFHELRVWKEQYEPEGKPLIPLRMVRRD